jgi:hypothetical protein
LGLPKGSSLMAIDWTPYEALKLAASQVVPGDSADGKTIVERAGTYLDFLRSRDLEDRADKRKASKKKAT